MKRLIENYTFNPVTRQVIIIDNENITHEKLLLITNMADGDIIFNFADNLKKGSILGNIITLNYDTTSMSTDDKLQIWVENTNPMFVTLTTCLACIKNVISRISYDASNQLRATVVGTVNVGGGTVNVGNGTISIGIGDMGKPATAILKSQEAFQGTVGKNFIRS